MQWSDQGPGPCQMLVQETLNSFYSLTMQGHSLPENTQALLYCRSQAHRAVPERALQSLVGWLVTRRAGRAGALHNLEAPLLRGRAPSAERIRGQGPSGSRAESPSGLASLKALVLRGGAVGSPQ